MGVTKGVNILVVDDEEDFLEPISYWLKSQGYFVTIAFTGEEMLQLLEARTFDIIFLDINMQPMSGFDCLRNIRAKWPNIPVIMLTALPSLSREEKAKELGADGFFYKGAEYRDAAAAIEEALAKKKLKGA